MTIVDTELTNEYEMQCALGVEQHQMFGTHLGERHLAGVGAHVKDYVAYPHNLRG